MNSKDSFESILSDNIQRFLAYKRALGCRFDVEESALRLLDRYLVQKHISSLNDHAWSAGPFSRFPTAQAAPKLQPSAQDGPQPA